MPNRPIEPHGKVMASATPRSSMSRDSGAEACTLVPPSEVTIWPMVLVAGRIFMPLMSVGRVIFLRAVEGAGVVHEGEAELHVLHLLGRVLAVPGVDGGGAALGVGEQEGQRGAGHDREAARLVARVDVGEVGDAVARHVVVVEGLAQLLRREQGGGDACRSTAFLMSSAQACSAGLSGCCAGTQLDSLRLHRLVLRLRRRRRPAPAAASATARAGG